MAGGTPAENASGSPANVGGMEFQPGATQNERSVGGVDDVGADALHVVPRHRESEGLGPVGDGTHGVAVQGES